MDEMRMLARAAGDFWREHATHDDQLEMLIRLQAAWFERLSPRSEQVGCRPDVEAEAEELRSHLRELLLKPGPAAKGPAANTRDVVARRAAGESVASIARHYGVTTSTIYHVLRHEPRRQQMIDLGVFSMRLWKTLTKLGVIRRTEHPEDLSRDTLIARMQTVDLKAIGDMKGVGTLTLLELRSLQRGE